MNCHDRDSWLPSHFDHASGSRFSLEGAHRGAECAACHPRVTGPQATTWVLYRPLDTNCSTCHGQPASRRNEVREVKP